MLAAGRHYDELLSQLDPDSGWARCGILQLATRETDLSAWEWVAERATGATEISARRGPRDGAGARHGDPRAASSACGARRRPRRCAPRSGAARRSTAWKCATVPSTKCAPVRRVTIVVDGDAITAPVGRDRGRRVDARGSASSSVSTCRSFRIRGQIAHLGVAEHDTGELADRAAGVRPLHGAVGRSPRRGRRDRRRRRLRARRDRGRRERDHARGAARDARTRGRDARRGARRPAPDEHRRLADPRTAARRRRTCSSPPVTAPTACCSARSPAG